MRQKKQQRYDVGGKRDRSVTPTLHEDTYEHTEEYGFSTQQKKIFDKSIEAAVGIIEDYKVAYKILGGNRGNTNTIPAILENTLKSIAKKLEIVDAPEFKEVFELVREAAQRIKIPPEPDELQRMTKLRDKRAEAAYDIAADFDALEILYDYRRDEILKEVETSLLAIADELRTFAGTGRGNADAIAWKQAELFLRAVFRMSISGHELLDEPKMHNKTDLNDLATDASAYPAVAFVGSETIRSLAKEARRIGTRENLEIMIEAINAYDMAQLNAQKLGRLQDNIEQINLDRRLTSELKTTIKILTGKRSKYIHWLVEKIAAEPEIAEFYSRKIAGNKPQISGVKFMAFLQFATIKDEKEEKVFDRLKRVDEEAKMSDELRNKLVLAMPILVTHERWAVALEMIERGFLEQLEEAVDTINDRKQADSQERAFALIDSATGQDSRISEIREISHTQPPKETHESRNTTEGETQPIYFKRIVIFSDSIHGPNIAHKLEAISKTKVVLVGNDRITKKYAAGLVREGDVIVIDASHIGHSKNGIALAAARSKEIPFVIGRRTNAERMLEEIINAA
ncbi:hypothetical protein HY990_02920 [Candidatus Micrarchaeota archaeon]|nr:hypothetical protein [Candidatus Micrarchaeota archaeon]